MIEGNEEVEFDPELEDWLGRARRNPGGLIEGASDEHLDMIREAVAICDRPSGRARAYVLMLTAPHEIRYAFDLILLMKNTGEPA